MFPRFVCAFFLIMGIIFSGTAVFAGKVELTTYYPAPYGEYSSLSAAKSFIPPKLTTDERDAISATSNPPLVQGMVIFNTTTNQLEVNKDGTATGWVSAVGGPPQLGEYELKDANTVYQAATSGFVVASSSSGGYYFIKSDDTNPPSTILCYAEGDAWNASRPSATVPIKKGKYWKVETSSGATPAVRWIPLE